MTRPGGVDPTRQTGGDIRPDHTQTGLADVRQQVQIASTRKRKIAAVLIPELSK